MFKATDELPDGAFSRIVAENGGSDNAFTSADYTAFFQRVAADRLDLVMGMEADRMVDLAPTEAGVLSERDVVIEERRQAVEARPGAGFDEEILRGALPEPPLRPAGHRLGARDRRADTARGRIDFYRPHYAPNNAILVVAGDVDADEVRGLAEKHFGPIPAFGGRSAPAPAGAAAPGRAPARDARRTGHGAGAAPESTSRRSGGAGDQKEAAALVVLAELLGGGRVDFRHGARAPARGWDRPSMPGPPIPTPGWTRRPSPLRRAEARSEPGRGRGGARRTDCPVSRGRSG